MHLVVLWRVGHPRVEALHDLGLLAVDELPEAVLRVPLPLVEVLQHACRTLLLEHPAIIMRFGFNSSPSNGFSTTVSIFLYENRSISCVSNRIETTTREHQQQETDLVIKPTQIDKSVYFARAIYISIKILYKDRNGGKELERVVGSKYKPDFGVAGDIADELHRADADGHARRQEQRVHLRAEPPLRPRRGRHR